MSGTPLAMGMLLCNLIKNQQRIAVRAYKLGCVGQTKIKVAAIP